ncbi:MAG: ornithine carbamoyltransferase [Elusimicrobia bacterium]|nr:ornithine carbamoyltransferase [Candidatus Liberimonas magnetica]
MAKNLLSIFDLSSKEIWSLFGLAKKVKPHKHLNRLAGKTLGLIFEKPSTRTSVSFSVAMFQLGGFPLILDVKNMQWQRGETVQDTARVLSKYIDVVMFRALKHSDVEAFASSSTIPVINGLTNKEHPCQILGDLLTLIEKRKISSAQELRKMKVVFMGDGNNVSNSWLGAAAIMGFNFILVGPKGYGPDKEILAKALPLSKKTGAKIEISDDVRRSVKGADLIYTDVWTSMGAEKEEKKRKVVFKPYQVNSELLKLAKKNCLVMHCLPAFRGQEITSDVLDGPSSVVLDQAENRLHIQKAILIHLLKPEK